MREVADLLAQLETLSGSDVAAFPYEGCRRLCAATGARHEHLIPDLDTYLSELAGYRTWGSRTLTWSDEKIETTEKRLKQSFFERFPVHAELKPLIETEASDVRRALQNADQTRETLLRLLFALRTSRSGGDQ